jgi:hypothetical protein
MRIASDFNQGQSVIFQNIFLLKKTKIEIDKIFGQIPFQHLSSLKADSNFSNLLVEVIATFDVQRLMFDVLCSTFNV